MGEGEGEDGGTGRKGVRESDELLGVEELTVGAGTHLVDALEQMPHGSTTLPPNGTSAQSTPEVSVSGFGFRVSGFGVSGFGVSGCGFRVWGLVCAR